MVQPLWRTVRRFLKKLNIELPKKKKRSSYHGAAEMSLTRNHEFAGLIPGLALWVKDPVLL